jgi:hypothetical protein
MTHEEAVAKMETLFAHAWMVRTFLKHADEISENEPFLDVHRTIFDCCRAVDPALSRGDYHEYLHRARGKLSKLRKAAEFFATHFHEVTDHMNWKMAAASLSGTVKAMEEVLAAVPKGMPS